MKLIQAVYKVLLNFCRDMGCRLKDDLAGHCVVLHHLKYTTSFLASISCFVFITGICYMGILPFHTIVRLNVK